jgi:Flp pilus assembly protein TadB
MIQRGSENMNIKIKDLTVSDFPGIDEAKFNEWKALKIKRNREQRIVFYIGVGILLILLILSLLTANPKLLLIFLILVIIDDWAGLIYVSYRRRYRHLRQLGKELKMSARLRAKKKGKEFTG